VLLAAASAAAVAGVGSEENVTELKDAATAIATLIIVALLMFGMYFFSKLCCILQSNYE